MAKTTKPTGINTPAAAAQEEVRRRAAAHSAWRGRGPIPPPVQPTTRLPAPPPAPSIPIQPIHIAGGSSRDPAAMFRDATTLPAISLPAAQPIGQGYSQGQRMPGGPVLNAPIVNYPQDHPASRNIQWSGAFPSHPATQGSVVTAPWQQPIAQPQVSPYTDGPALNPQRAVPLMTAPKPVMQPNILAKVASLATAALAEYQRVKEQLQQSGQTPHADAFLQNYRASQGMAGYLRNHPEKDSRLDASLIHYEGGYHPPGMAQGEMMGTNYRRAGQPAINAGMPTLTEPGPHAQRQMALQAAADNFKGRKPPTQIYAASQNPDIQQQLPVTPTVTSFADWSAAQRSGQNTGPWAGQSGQWRPNQMAGIKPEQAAVMKDRRAGRQARGTSNILPPEIRGQLAIAKAMGQRITPWQAAANNAMLTGQPVTPELMAGYNPGLAAQMMQGRDQMALEEQKGKQALALAPWAVAKEFAGGVGEGFVTSAGNGTLNMPSLMDGIRTAVNYLGGMGQPGMTAPSAPWAQPVAGYTTPGAQSGGIPMPAQYAPPGAQAAPQPVVSYDNQAAQWASLHQNDPAAFEAEMEAAGVPAGERDRLFRTHFADEYERRREEKYHDGVKRSRRRQVANSTDPAVRFHTGLHPGLH